MKIAIHQNKEIFNHTTDWGNVWIEYCEKNDLDYEIVNCLSHNIIEQIRDFDILLWHFSHYALSEMMVARSILLSVNQMGIKTFPNHNTSWHFDDKVAQSYLLESIGAPLPESWNFYTKQSALNFFEKDCLYPIVAKLKTGSGSTNVLLLKNEKEAIKYTNKMFGKGINPSPNLLYKAKSNIKTSKNVKTFIDRMKRIPDFMQSLKKAKEFSNEYGYVSLQEFLPNDGYDLKVAVVNDKLSFVARDVRRGDFRASGGGAINYDKSLITSEIIEIAFDISEELDFQCMGIDFVVDSRTNIPKIIEISYGFSNQAQLDLGGHWNRSGVWIDQPLNAPVEVLKNLMKSERVSDQVLSREE